MVKVKCSGSLAECSSTPAVLTPSVPCLYPPLLQQQIFFRVLSSFFLRLLQCMLYEVALPGLKAKSCRHDP